MFNTQTEFLEARASVSRFIGQIRSALTTNSVGNIDPCPLLVSPDVMIMIRRRLNCNPHEEGLKRMAEHMGRLLLIGDKEVWTLFLKRIQLLANSERGLVNNADFLFLVASSPFRADDWVK